jgi:integrase
MKLTTIACTNAKPKEKPYKLADGGGLYLLVNPNSSKYWRLKYRHLGKEKVLALGIFPLVSLADARDKRNDAKKLMMVRTDPAAAKKGEKRQAILNSEQTFEAIAREWHSKEIDRWKPIHGRSILQRLEHDVFADIGNRPIAEISASELLHTIKAIEKRGANEVARKTLRICGQVFKYAIITDRRPDSVNPAAALSGALKSYKKGHFAALDARDLPAFLKKLEMNVARLYPQTIRATRLLMLTFVRTSELIQAKWDEFDLEAREWIIPAERMKMAKEHIVPLSRQVVALLKEQKKLTGEWQWVFPSIAHPRKHMSNNTILGALKRMGYKGEMTGHGFRALAMSTIKEKLNYRHEVIDRQLAHAHRNSVDAAYDRAQFLPERRKMMQQWADYLHAVATDDKMQAKVLKIRG